jgi:hypothetical protein
MTTWYLVNYLVTRYSHLEFGKLFFFEFVFLAPSYNFNWRWCLNVGGDNFFSVVLSFFLLFVAHVSVAHITPRIDYKIQIILIEV